MDEPVLKNLWDADVPASDPHFTLAVMARIEQRRFRGELAQITGLAVLAAGLLGVLAPTLEWTWRKSFAPHLSNFEIMLLLATATLLLLLPKLMPARD